PRVFDERADRHLTRLTHGTAPRAARDQLSDRLHARDDGGADGRGHLLEERLHIVEVDVEGGLRDPGLRGDFTSRQARGAATIKEPNGAPDEPVPGADLGRLSRAAHERTAVRRT